MKVSAILCHHKGRELILKAIASLKHQKNVEIEIIVATSVKDAVFQGTKTIYVQGGPAYKRNIAFRYASHDLIAFFDDDIEATPTAVYEMGKALRDTSTGLVFGKLLNMEHRNRFDEAGSFLTSSGFLWARAESGVLDRGQFDVAGPVLAGKSASCMIKRNVFAEIGMFDASYEILGEESDLAWRVWLSGYFVIYVPSSVTFHAFGTRFKPPDMYTPARVYKNGCRNYLTMLYSNLGKKRWIIPLMTQLAVWTTAAIGMLITGKFEAGINIFKGLGYFFRNIRTIWKKRCHVQWKLRKVSDKELMPIILRNPPVSYYLNRFVHYIKTGRHG
jgi:GT2 family glycosyltransferase